MNVVKVKVLSIESSIKPVLIDETKPDKRYTCGYRKTGKKVGRLSVNTKLISSYDPYIRIGSFVLVVGFGRMRVVDVQKSGQIRFINLNLSLQEDYKLAFKVDEYVDIATLGFIVGESSSRQL